MTTRAHVLCVDDERMVLSSLREQLRRALGSEVRIEIAESAAEGLEVFRELKAANCRVPLVISDQVMPGMKGDELLAELHALDPDALTILLTGQATADAVGAAVNSARLYRYIGKPWVETDLVMTVREALRAWDREREIAARRAELEETFAITRRFVPNDILHFLGRETIRQLALGDQTERRMSVLFCDLRDFTGRCEGMVPAESFAFVNTLLGRLGPVVRVHGGFVDKYLGDAIMAVFPGDADAAVSAAVELQRELAAFNADPAERPGHPVRAGIGLHTGPVVLGIIGERERWSGTVISDAVNVAARLEALTAERAEDILISDATRAAMADPGRWSMSPVSGLRLRGRTEPLDAWAVHALAPADRRQP